jgi:hypothetical protein
VLSGRVRLCRAARPHARRDCGRRIRPRRRASSVRSVDACRFAAVETLDVLSGRDVSCLSVGASLPSCERACMEGPRQTHPTRQESVQRALRRHRPVPRSAFRPGICTHCQRIICNGLPTMHVHAATPPLRGDKALVEWHGRRMSVSTSSHEQLAVIERQVRVSSHERLDVIARATRRRRATA